MLIRDPRAPAPLVMIAVAWIAGVISGFYFPLKENYSLFYIFIPLITISALTFFLLRGSIGRIVIIILLFIFAGYLRSTISSRLPANHINRFLLTQGVIVKEIEMRITEEVEAKDYIDSRFLRVEGDLISLEGYPVTGKIILNFPERYLIDDPGDLHINSIVTTVAELTPYSQSRGFSRIPAPYFTNRSIKSAQGVARTPVYIRGNHSELTGREQDIFSRYWSAYRSHIIQLRQFLNKRIAERIPERELPFVRAIILGNREETGDMRDLLVRGGMSHLIAISGLHLGIITLIMLTLLKIFYIRRTPARIILIVFLLSYAELCNWSPSVSRATVMLSLLMLCGILQRKPSYNNIMAVSLLLITIIDPLQIFSIGLQLSFISVFVLINILPLFNGYLSNFTGIIAARAGLKGHGFRASLYRFCQLLLVTLFISLFLLPFNLYYFNQFSLNGLLANPVGIVLLTLIIPLSLLIIVLPSVPLILLPFQETFGCIMYLFTEWSNIAASLPLFFNFIPFGPYQLLFAYIFLFLFFLWLRRLTAPQLIRQSRRTAASARPERIEPVFKIGFYPALMGIILLLIVGSSLIRKDNLLIVTLFHTGHGDLFLIETPERERILIDTGPQESSGLHFSSAALPYLKQQGIRRFDWLIVTHQHNDHYGGLPFIAENLNIGRLIITEDFYEDDIWQELATHIDTIETMVCTITDTTHIPLSSLDCKIIHPDREFFSLNPNEMSIVVQISYENFSILFTGDIEREAENYLLNRYSPFLENIFLKVAHHGSRTSSSPPFIAMVNPRFAFIPTAGRSRFNLPHDETIKTLEPLVEELFISSEEGTVQIRTDGLTARIKTFQSERDISVIF